MTDAERQAMKDFIQATIRLEVARAGRIMEKRSRDSVVAESMQLGIRFTSQIQEEVRAALPSLRGEKGDPGDKGGRGDNGQDGQPGADGKDGIGLQGEKGIDGKDGVDGRDGKDGRAGIDGVNGKDADPDVVRSEVAKAVAALPAPKNGRDGADGKDVDLLVVKALVAGEVAHAVAAMPPPKDGRDGKDGITEERMEDTTLKVVAAVLGELRLEGRNLMLGDRLIKTLPIPIYRGVYEPGTSYEPGDMTSFGGSIWHCDEATMEKPESTRAWKLAVKKGRDGREPARMAEKGVVKR